MPRSTMRMAGDYNRALCPEFRAVHMVLAVLAAACRPFLRWMLDPRRKARAFPLVIAGIGFVLLYPFDWPLSHFARNLPISGDIKRELTAWQQYGALTSLLVVAVIVALLDRARWRRLLDLAAAELLCLLACNFFKNFIGRPRPILDDPNAFLWPWGMYPVPIKASQADQLAQRQHFILTHAWGGSAGRGSRAVTYELWSMPSSHTACAVVLSVFLAAMYPRLRPLVIVLACLVGLTRIITAAHWPSDVLIGATLGYTIASLAIHNHWGMRALDSLWIRFIDQHATPSIKPQRTTPNPLG